jgi:hypothetical protein
VDLRPDRARDLAQECVQLVPQVSTVIGELQQLGVRPGAFGTLGAPVAAGAELLKLRQLTVLLSQVTALSQLNTFIRAAADSIQKRDEERGEAFRHLIRDLPDRYHA